MILSGLKGTSNKMYYYYESKSAVLNQSDLQNMQHGGWEWGPELRNADVENEDKGGAESLNVVI